MTTQEILDLEWKCRQEAHEHRLQIMRLEHESQRIQLQIQHAVMAYQIAFGQMWTLALNPDLKDL